MKSALNGRGRSADPIQRELSQVAANIIKTAFPGLLDGPVVQLELFLVLATLALGFERRRLAGVDRLFRRWSRRPARAFAGCAALALVLHLVAAPLLTRHAPEVHDEFSYLLSADTFLHGSLVNPPHALWRSLEAAHVLFRPHYASMYPPGQGLLLAAGKLLFGDYLAGPWLITALLAGLAGWMLSAWVPARWALFGAFLVALRFGIFTYWGNSYWGGAVAAAGGMLVFGAIPRVLRGEGARHAALGAFGLVLLAANRPFEAVLALGAAALAALAIHPKRRRKPCLSAIAATSVVLLIGGASLLYFNWRVSGNPLTLGYNLSMRRYGLAVFPWQSTVAASPPADANLARFYQAQHRWFHLDHTPSGFLYTRTVAFGRFWAFYLGPLFTLAFLAIPALVYSRRWRWIVIAGLFYGAGLTLNPWFFPHYAAPAMGLLLLALIQACRLMCAARLGGRRPFVFAVRAMPAVCSVVFVFAAMAPLLDVPLPDGLFAMPWYHTPPGNQARAAVEYRLEDEPGRHLVLVRYQPGHMPNIGWVYNEARIDEAKVVWAHDLDPATNARLLAYYAGRHVWRLDADAHPPRLVEQSGPFDSGLLSSHFPVPTRVRAGSQSATPPARHR